MPPLQHSPEDVGAELDFDFEGVVGAARAEVELGMGGLDLEVVVGNKRLAGQGGG